MHPIISRRLATTRTALLAAVTVATLACDGGSPAAPDTSSPSGPTPPTTSRGATVRTITVTPGAIALHPAWRDSLGVVLTDSAGNTLTGRAVTYVTENEQVATVRDGIVTGIGEGATAVRVTSEGITVRVPVTVTRAPAHSIAIVPGDTTITEGQQRLVVVSLRDAQGNALADLPITWSTSDASIVAVTPLGGLSSAAHVAAVSGGEATVSASAGGLTATVQVRVRPRVARVTLTPESSTLHIGEELQLVADVRDAAGNALTDRSVMYVSSGGLGPVSSTGRVRAMLDGTFRVIAWAEGVADTVTVTVLKPVYFVDVTPRMVTMSVGTTLPLAVTLKDNAGRVLTGRTVIYGTMNPGVATVSGSGVVTASGRGVTMITVACEGRTTQVQVTVL